jgi:hypothetical protein
MERDTVVSKYRLMTETHTSFAITKRKMNGAWTHFAGPACERMLSCFMTILAARD